MGFPPPQFNTPLFPNQIAPELPYYPIYGVTPDNRYIPISVDEQGRLEIGAEIGPITIGDVNIKGLNPDTNTWQGISVVDWTLSGGGYAMRTSLYYNNTPLKINPDGSINVSGEVVVTPSVEEHVVDSPTDLYTPGTTKGVLSDYRVVSTPPTLTAGEFSAATLTTAGRLIVDGSQVTQPISGSVSILNFPAVQPVSQSGTWNVNNVTGTVSLPTNASKETGGNLDSINAGIQTLNSLVPSKYDYIDLQYSGSNLTQAKFYLGGPTGTLVSTLLLQYSGANLTSVTRV